MVKVDWHSWFVVHSQSHVFVLYIVFLVLVFLVDICDAGRLLNWRGDAVSVDGSESFGWRSLEHRLNAIHSILHITTGLWWGAGQRI